LYGSRTNRSNGVFKIIDDALERKKIQYVGNKNSIRKYIHVIDAAKATVNLMSSKYKNKYVNIVGDKSYKVTELLDSVSKSLKISGKINFLNAKMMGHYIKSPKLFRLRAGINYRLKKYTKFKNGVNYLIHRMKKN
jgi:nucleoside-diphosphate-sugar epimerase